MEVSRYARRSSVEVDEVEEVEGGFRSDKAANNCESL